MLDWLQTALTASEIIQRQQYWKFESDDELREITFWYAYFELRIPLQNS